VGRIGLGLVGALVLAAGGPAWGQVTLAYKFAPGADVVYRTGVDVDQTLTINGQAVPTRSKQTVRTRQAVGAKRADGSVPVTQTIESVKTELELPGGIALAVDSEDNAAPPANEPPQLKPIREAIRGLDGAAFTIVVGPDGKVAGIEGAEAAIKAEGVDPMVKESLQSRFDAAALKRDAAQEIERFPAILVNPGDTWEKTEVMDLGGGQSLTFRKQYKYEGTVQKEGKTFDRITSKDQSVTYAMAANPALPVSVNKSDLKVDSSDGELLFDREAGRPASAGGKVHITGTLELALGGQALPATLDLTLSSTTAIEAPGTK
jgi:hypothetical protein